MKKTAEEMLNDCGNAKQYEVGDLDSQPDGCYADFTMVEIDKDNLIDLMDRYTDQFKPKWVSVEERLPESEDNSVLVYFGLPDHTGFCGYVADMVHIQDYFDDITDGYDEHGNQLYTKWYLSRGITHWMPLPEPPKTV
jgi:hypothetical protein